MDEAAGEIERLRNIVSGYTDGISAGDESNKSYAKNDEKRMNTNMSFTLTDAEREAINVARIELNTLHCFEDHYSHILKNLLVRLA